MQKKCFNSKITGILLVFCQFVIISLPLGAQAFEKGSELFRNNKPAEASVYLEQALKTDPSNYMAYLYLGLCQYQLGVFDKSVSTFRQALSLGLGNAGELHFNIADVLRASGKLDEARAEYALASSLWLNSSAPDLNLGNLEFRSSRYPEAIASYKKFLEKTPDDALAPTVVRMIALLQGELQAQELAKKAQEARIAQEQEDKKKAEADRIAKQEEERQAEDRRQQLMDQVFSDLDDFTSSSSSLSAGSEDVMDTQDTLERED